MIKFQCTKLRFLSAKYNMWLDIRNSTNNCEDLSKLADYDGNLTEYTIAVSH